MSKARNRLIATTILSVVAFEVGILIGLSVISKRRMNDENR